VTATEPIAPPAELPARLVWLNGPYSIGKRTLAEFVRDHWQVAMFDAEAWGNTLQRGLPAQHDAGDLQELEVWLRSVLRLGTELAWAFRPVVVMPATIYRRNAVLQLLDRFRKAGVDVVHVVMSTDEATLRARIHDRDVDAYAKRWAIQHLRPSLAGLSGLQDTLQLDATSRSPEQLAKDLARVLYEHDWLTETGEWTPAGR
jgi:hypothetical protein